MNGMVRALFDRLEQSGLRYVILRNYEQLCDVPLQDAAQPHVQQHVQQLVQQQVQPSGQATDIDLVIATEDIPRWRTIAVSLAEDFGWDALTECDHFTQSRKREHDIQIFRYYRHADQCFLQVDLFHSYLIWGLPFLTEGELLAGRVSDPQRGLTRIDPVQENTFRLLQIQGLIGYKDSATKIARYRDRILKFDQEHGPEFRAFLNSSLGGHATEILDALERADWARYRKTMRRGKALFWSKFASRKPVQAAQFLAARLLESRKRYLSRPCGPLIKVHAEDSRSRDRFVSILKGMRRLNFIDQWHERRPGALLDKGALVIREQGGLLVEWIDSEQASGQADLHVTSAVTCTEIWRFIVDVLVRQHAPLFLREGVYPPIRVCLETLVEA